MRMNRGSSARKTTTTPVWTSSQWPLTRSGTVWACRILPSPDPSCFLTTKDRNLTCSWIMTISSPCTNSTARSLFFPFFYRRKNPQQQLRILFNKFENLREQKRTHTRARNLLRELKTLNQLKEHFPIS